MKQKKNTKTIQKKERVVLLRFLKQTKSGKYGFVEKFSIPYSRKEEPREFIDTEEKNYYYSLS